MSETVGSGGSSAGNSGSGNSGGSSGGGLAGECANPGARRCNGNVREQCSPDNEWQPLPDSEQCGGDMSACTGNGVCAALRLTTGTIDGLAAPPPPADAAYVLRDSSLLTNPKSCGETFCVSGGIRP